MLIQYHRRLMRIALVIVSGGFIVFPSISFADYPYPCEENKVVTGNLHSYKSGWLTLEGKYGNACEVVVNKNGANQDYLTLPVSLDYIAGQQLCSLAYNVFLNKFSATFHYCRISKTGDISPVYRLRTIEFINKLPNTGKKVLD